ncbi:MAG: hypothetical protein JNL74_22985 [Fibrobacteres bacterium]|nr:hypothetical protein [Fibrobacterota bacterium]
MNKKLVIAISAAVILLAGLLYYFVFRKDLSDKIILPYIVHQKGTVDPHIQSSVPLADQLDEILFDGLFNVSADKSGIIYEDGLGELIGVDESGIVTVRLKKGKKWHSSYKPVMNKNKVSIEAGSDQFFEAQDLSFTLDRIRRFGSLSPDYVLVSQAVPDFTFSGPDENNDIRFQFKTDRIWSQNDVKEVLSFKVLPAASKLDAENYSIGTGPYIEAGEYENTRFFVKKPDGEATLTNFLLKPYIDNSTFITEFKNRNINALLGTPFVEISTILQDTAKYFYKSTISTSFFAILFNTQRLNLEQRKALRKLINNEDIMNRFFKVGTMQQRHIANYKGEGDNYKDYLNKSLFPSSSYYVNEGIVIPGSEADSSPASVLPDTVRIQTCINYQFREELSELVQIINDSWFDGVRLQASAVENNVIAEGNYDAVIVPVSGYRSNFLFDLYSIFLRKPDFASTAIALVTTNDKNGKNVPSLASFSAGSNFMRIDLNGDMAEKNDMTMFLYTMFDFMSASEIGDKQQYAILADQQENQLALGEWLFSLPSLAYFNTQFDPQSIELYGTASQLSAVERWKERKR